MFRPLATSAAALIAAASPVLAEVTPAQVWDNISKYYTDMGYQVTAGDRDEAGDTLTLSDVKIMVDAEASDVSIAIPKMILRQTGDAKVRTVIDGEITADMTSEVPDQDDVSIHVIMSVPDNVITSSGSPEDMLHEIMYPDLLIGARLGAGDAGAAVDGMPIQVQMNDVAGSYHSVAGAGARSTYDMTAASVALKLDLKDFTPEEGSGETGTVTARTVVDGLKMTGGMIAPEGTFDMTDNLHGALKAGLVIDGTFAMGPMTGNAEFSGTDADGVQKSGNATFSSASSELAVSMTQDALNYQGSVKGTQAEMNIADMPFPISYAIESASGNLAFPVSKSDQPQPFKFSYALAGLTLADGIWGLFDPNGQLPRDPASLSVDVEGTATVTEDLLDPAMAERMEKAEQELAEAEAQAEEGAMPEDMPMPPMPFHPETVKINRIALDAVGAKADVTGDLTIPDGAAQPVGKIEGSFEGINSLLDTLVSMGLVPQEQVMGARMMIAMFARPAADNPDKLTTELEFREDGAIFANGQQVK